MKKIIVFVLLFSAALFAGGGLNWVTTNNAIAKAQKENKYILVVFEKTGCAKCDWLIENPMSNLITKYLIEKFYVPVLMNVDQSDKFKFGTEETSCSLLSDRWEVTGFPTMVILNSKGEFVTKVNGAKESKELLSMLTYVASGKIKNRSYSNFLSNEFANLVVVINKVLRTLLNKDNQQDNKDNPDSNQESYDFSRKVNQPMLVDLGLSESNSKVKGYQPVLDKNSYKVKNDNITFFADIKSDNILKSIKINGSEVQFKIEPEGYSMVNNVDLKSGENNYTISFSDIFDNKKEFSFKVIVE